MRIYIKFENYHNITRGVSSSVRYVAIPSSNIITSQFSINELLLFLNFTI